MKKQNPRQSSRRNFAKHAVAALATAPLMKSEAVTAAQQAPSALATAQIDLITARFGSQLSDAQLTQIKKDIAGLPRTQDRLRAAKLKNSDEPDFIFVVSSER